MAIAIETFLETIILSGVFTPFFNPATFKSLQKCCVSPSTDGLDFAGL